MLLLSVRKFHFLFISCLNSVLYFCFFTGLLMWSYRLLKVYEACDSRVKLFFWSTEWTNSDADLFFLFFFFFCPWLALPFSQIKVCSYGMMCSPGSCFCSMTNRIPFSNGFLIVLRCWNYAFFCPVEKCDQYFFSFSVLFVCVCRYNLLTFSNIKAVDPKPTILNSPQSVI